MNRFAIAMEIRQDVMKDVSHCLQATSVDSFVVANLNQDLILFVEQKKNSAVKV